jgi:hypothetical protein
MKSLETSRHELQRRPEAYGRLKEKEKTERVGQTLQH